MLKKKPGAQEVNMLYYNSNDNILLILVIIVIVIVLVILSIVVTENCSCFAPGIARCSLGGRGTQVHAGGKGCPTQRFLPYAPIWIEELMPIPKQQAFMVTKKPTSTFCSGNPRHHGLRFCNPLQGCARWGVHCWYALPLIRRAAFILFSICCRLAATMP